MAAITVRTNLKEVTADILARLEKIKNPEYLLRPVAFDVIDLMTNRIHMQGKASDGKAIGNYSKGYMKTRDKAGRMEGEKVVISLTRQLENDWSVIATPKGYGVGFKNILNYNKSVWVESTYKKKIFALSESETEYVTERLNELVNDALNS